MRGGLPRIAGFYSLNSFGELHSGGLLAEMAVITVLLFVVSTRKIKKKFF